MRAGLFCESGGFLSHSASHTVQKRAELSATDFFQTCLLSGWGRCFVHRSTSIIFFFSITCSGNLILKDSFVLISCFHILFISSAKLILRAALNNKNFFEETRL